MRDHQTTTEDAAGRLDRATAYPEEDLREHDEPGVPVERDHDCGGDPECRDLLCALGQVVAAQKAGRR